MKKIIMLGGSPQQIIAIETAKKLGLYTILCDYLPDNPGQYYADKFYQISTTDRDAVLSVAIDEAADYIIAYASDPAAPIAAYVAEKLGMPSNPYYAVETLCNKDKFRKFLNEHGFNAPVSKSYADIESALNDKSEFNYPVIVKPVDSSGSKGVTTVYSKWNYTEAVTFAFSFSRVQRIIVEEYIEKSHEYLVGGDVFVVNGKITQWGLMNCHRDCNVNPLVPVGKSYPVKIDSNDYNSIKKELQRIVTELGIRFGPMNVEVIVDKQGKVFLIDVGPRSGGNMIPDLLGMIFNCDVVEMTVRSAIGEKVHPQINNENIFYATHNIHSSEDGILKDICFSNIIEQFIVRKVFYKKPGDKVQYFDNASKALGIVFMKFNSMEQMMEVLININEYIIPLVGTTKKKEKEE